MKEYIELQAIEFNQHEERLKSSNYGSQGFYVSRLVDTEVGVNTSDLVFVNPNIEQVLFICPAELIEDMGLIEKIETENAKKNLVLRKSLESKINHLEKRNDQLMNENELLRISEDTKDKELKATKKSDFSESFVLELAKILTQKNH